MPEKIKKLKETTETFRLLSIVSNIGFVMVGCIITGFFIGFAINKYLLDSKNMIVILIFTLLGVISGFYNVYKLIMNKIL